MGQSTTTHQNILASQVSKEVVTDQITLWTNQGEEQPNAEQSWSI
jgi:hypothetical protein